MNDDSPPTTDEIESFSNAQLQIDDLPRWEEVEFDRLARNAPWVVFWEWSVPLLISVVVVLVTLFVPFIPLRQSLGALGVIAVLFTIVQCHNFAEHRVRGVALRQHDLVFRKGLFWQRRTFLPFNRVQHIETHRHPIERQLGLSSLKVFTAGGSGVDLKISGLEEERADRIKQYILEHAKQEVVAE